MKAIIAAAGQGSRISSVADRAPKTLLPIGLGTILSRIMANFGAAGITEFVVVVGFRGEVISEYLRANDNFGFRVTIIENEEWRRGNGISVHRAGSVLQPGENALLSMADHLVSPDALRAMVKAGSGANLLLVDPRVEQVHDLDDATKVQVEGRRIVRIGKELTEFNAIDCGVFLLTPRFFAAMGRQITCGRESISDGVRELIGQGDFETVTIPDTGRWIDIDTPEAYAEALTRLEQLS